MRDTPFFSHFAAVSASDTVAHADGQADALWVGGAGVVPVVRADGTVVNFTAVAGSVIPVRSIRVNSTNLTATLLVALYRAKGEK